MRLQMVHGDQGLLVDQRDRLGGDQAHNHAADQPRSGRRCNTVKSAELSAGIGHGGRDDAIESLHMGAGGDFRHHAAECGMLSDLRQHHIRANRGAAVIVAFHHGGCRFIAGRFYAEHKHWQSAGSETFAFLRSVLKT